MGEGDEGTMEPDKASGIAPCDGPCDGPVALRRPVVLVGMMGAGKTSVGTALARALAVPFLDSDEEIVKAAQMPISEIFARDGEAFFRARESEVIARLLSDRPAVISTGGGAFMSAANRDQIGAGAVSVWLKADLDLLWNRVRHKSTRPLLRTADPKGTLARLLDERAPYYALAHLTVEAEPGLSVEAMAQKVIEALRIHPAMAAAPPPEAAQDGRATDSTNGEA